MIIAFQSRISVDRWFSISLWVIWLSSLCVGGAIALQWLQPTALHFEQEVIEKKEGINLGAMLTGPLSLYENQRSALAVALEHKLVLLGQSTRPDWDKKQKVFRIGIRGSELQQVVKEAEPIFFDLKQHPSGGVETIAFSSMKHGYKMVPRIVEGKVLTLQLENGEQLKLSSMKKEEGSNGQPPEVTALTKGIFWGTDQFFSIYGGKEYQPLGKRYKLEIKEGAKPYFLFLNDQDFLSFSNGKWERISSPQEADKKAALAKIEKMGNQLSVVGWDAGGFLIFDTILKPEAKGPLQVAIDQVITDAKLRSAKQISCKIGKKRLLLKAGDWLLRTQSGWHKLSSLDEIEAYLSHQLRGELFVVDSIDTHGKLKGHCFDPMRTQMQPFFVQAATSKKKPRKRGSK